MKKYLFVAFGLAQLLLTGSAALVIMLITDIIKLFKPNK